MQSCALEAATWSARYREFREWLADEDTQMLACPDAQSATCRMIYHLLLCQHLLLLLLLLGIGAGQELTVLYLEALDCILKACHEVHVCVHGLIANIALHKDLAGLQSKNLVRLQKHNRQS